MNVFFFFFTPSALSIYKKYLAFYTRRVDPTLAAFIVCGPLQGSIPRRGESFVFLSLPETFLSLLFYWKAAERNITKVEF